MGVSGEEGSRAFGDQSRSRGVISNVEGLDGGRVGFASNVHNRAATSHRWSVPFVFLVSRRTRITTEITSAANLHRWEETNV